MRDSEPVGWKKMRQGLNLNWPRPMSYTQWALKWVLVVLVERKEERSIGRMKGR